MNVSVSGLFLQVGVSLRPGEPPQGDILIQQRGPQRRRGTRTSSLHLARGSSALALNLLTSLSPAGPRVQCLLLGEGGLVTSVNLTWSVELSLSSTEKSSLHASQLHLELLAGRTLDVFVQAHFSAPFTFVPRALVLPAYPCFGSIPGSYSRVLCVFLFVYLSSLVQGLPACVVAAQHLSCKLLGHSTDLEGVTVHVCCLRALARFQTLLISTSLPGS